MDAELTDRIMECLRGLDVGEGISADGIADEIGEKLSDVYDAIERLEAAKLVQLYPAFRKGSDPTYTLTAKGRHQMQPEVMQTPPEMPEKKAAAPAVRPSADRVCRFCGKELEPNKVRRHENMCGKNPNRPDAHPNRAEPDPVPAPIEYAEESNATATIEHEAAVEDQPPLQRFKMYAPGAIHDVKDEGGNTIGQYRDIIDVTPMRPEDLNADVQDAPDEVPEEPERDVKCDVLVLKTSPGMSALLRLLSCCQQAVEEGADLSLDAHVKVADGFYVSVGLDIPPVKETP